MFSVFCWLLCKFCFYVCLFRWRRLWNPCRSTSLRSISLWELSYRALCGLLNWSDCAMYFSSTGFFVDCVMQRYGCCGDKGGCCRKASEDEVVNEPGDAAETSHLAERSGTANNPIEPVWLTSSLSWTLTLTCLTPARPSPFTFSMPDLLEWSILLIVFVCSSPTRNLFSAPQDVSLQDKPQLPNEAFYRWLGSRLCVGHSFHLVRVGTVSCYENTGPEMILVFQAVLLPGSVRSVCSQNFCECCWKNRETALRTLCVPNVWRNRHQTTIK